MMVSPTAVETNGVEWAKKHPVGTGPFKFSSYEADVSVKYVRFDDYWQEGLPYLDSIEFDAILDSVVGGIAFQMGEGDMIIPTTPVAIELVGKDYPYNMYEAAFNVLAGNMTDPESPFSNKNVRLAMEYAIDKGPAMNVTGGGFWIPQYQVCPPKHPSYIDPFPGARTQNVALAQALLADSPWPTGFNTTLVLSSAFWPRPDLFVIFQAQWAAIGIHVTISVVSHGAWMALRGGIMPKNQITTAIIGTKGDWAVALGTYFTTGSGLYKWVVRPAGFDGNVTEALLAPTKAEHVAHLQAAQMLLFEDATCVPLMCSLGYCFYHDNVHDHHFREFHEGQWTPETCWLS
jgi:ABC-type transport system substrate-binding protein